MTGTSKEDGDVVVVTIPNWAKASIGSLVLAAGTWGYNVNNTMAEMAGEIRVLKDITSERFTALKERLDRERREDNAPKH
jgi:cbb3-type cytochrome oxidase subunit 1